MSAKVTKKAINALLVAERAKSRAKQKNSKFMARTLSIYKGQKKRAAEKKVELDFSLEEFRTFFRAGLETVCAYSGVRLTLTTATADHDIPIVRGGSFGLNNQRVCTQSANFQKGLMTGDEFSRFMQEAQITLDPMAFYDMKRRLTTGGKWNAKRF